MKWKRPVQFSAEMSSLGRHLGVDISHSPHTRLARSCWSDAGCSETLGNVRNPRGFVSPVLVNVERFWRRFSKEERAFMRAVVPGLADLEAGRELSLAEAKARLGLK